MGKHSSIILLTIFIFVGCAIKNTSSTKKNSITIKVMSYNVHHCNPPGRSGIIDIDTIAAVIKKEDADIVALQEIDVNTSRSGKINQAEQIALKAGYPFFFFGKAIDFAGGAYGIVILSKYKLTETKVHALPTDATTNAERRAIAMATVTLPGGKTIQFGNTHLDAERSSVNRLLQVTEINRIADQVTIPFIIAGDFNAVEGSDVINTLDESFARTCKKCEPLKSGNTREKVIDFIAYKPAKSFSVLSHRVVPEYYASDHFPIVATIQIMF
jgi:endonuclease/exonuclease/phosphatase family metal-dependent hydrolase